ncbi:ankyrin repeat domain-containing protein 45 [Colossoma macropomum]|uniref:ankyrin repeat domain-containing protein 45 n=1 Tax=Colossoma macropomum TaxID=42526 RepID=UPI001864A9D6|nr:ankyrin repeat domain-containing protein 45 [Colossoma macropomum]
MRFGCYGDKTWPASTEKTQLSADKTVFSCALEGDVEGLQDFIDNGWTDEASQNILRETDVVGRNALCVACMLGRSSFVRNLVVKNCADVNDPTTRGYSPLHYSAMWGQLDTVMTLFELGADLQAISFCGERAIDLARRYLYISKLDCAHFLAWAEAKQSLQASITRMKGILADPEKVQGKVNKEDKRTCINICSVKSDWIQNAKNPTIQDFAKQKQYLEDVVAPIMTKLTAQCKFVWYFTLKNSSSFSSFPLLKSENHFK